MTSPLKLPDSELCLAALELARVSSDDFLFNHVIRAFIFADAAAQARGLRYDRELLFIACALHDLGLTERAPVKTRFEVEGADMAQAFLAARGVDAQKQALIWDAIALHTTLVIPQRKAAEIALCQLGTAIDVGFAPRALIEEAVIEEALARYPRLGFKRAMQGAVCGLLKRNAEAAASSQPVAEVGERMVPGFSKPHFCDVLEGAEFSE